MSGKEIMITVLIKIKILSPEHELQLTNLALNEKIDYGVMKNQFFVRVNIDERITTGNTT